MRERRSLHRIQFILAGGLIGLMLLTSACGGNPQVQQQANASKAQLDAQLQHAQAIGVPLSILQPVLAQEQQLSSSSAPFTPFNDQPATDYYANLTIRYHQLLVQLQGIVLVTTQQFQSPCSVGFGVGSEVGVDQVVQGSGLGLHGDLLGSGEGMP